jgi:glycosyltransferase involved in cell wall biosynthesis
MKLKEYLVSVILPVHNAEKFLTSCLESLQQQTYEQLQIIAIDDNSSDRSFEILKKFKKHIKGLEISQNKKRYGLAICHNRGMKQARGRFIAFMNPHDINAANRFKRQITFLLKNPKTVAVGTQYTSIDEQNRKLQRSDLPREHDLIYDKILQTSIQPETIMINRTLMPKDLLYFKSNKYPFIFTEILVKLFQYGKVENIPYSLYFHREGIKRHGRRYRHYRLKHFTSMMKIWFSTKSYNDDRPSLRSLFSPLVKGI